jgi:hypothetical protein
MPSSSFRSLATAKALSSLNFLANDRLTHLATDVTRKGVSSHA